MSNTENVLFYLNEGGVENNLDIDFFLQEFHNLECGHHLNKSIGALDDEIFTQMKNYELNFNVKQLLLICEYYGLKMNKMKKQDIIEQIILYENNTDNIDVVIKRKELWYYMGELKNDKIMKKFVIW
uniref:Uncharacterized protein n=1 Tax=viral metagenome TaxID=1070528 RepID=A0A6C0HWI2_9ZZZZ